MLLFIPPLLLIISQWKMQSKGFPQFFQNDFIFILMDNDSRNRNAFDPTPCRVLPTATLVLRPSAICCSAYCRPEKSSSV